MLLYLYYMSFLTYFNSLYWRGSVLQINILLRLMIYDKNYCLHILKYFDILNMQRARSATGVSLRAPFILLQI